MIYIRPPKNYHPLHFRVSSSSTVGMHRPWRLRPHTRESSRPRCWAGHGGIGNGRVAKVRVFKRFEITHVGQLLHKLCCDLNNCKETRLFFEAWNFVQCLTPSMFIVVFPIETFASANRRFLVGTGPGRQRDDIMRRFFLWPWTYWPWYFPRNIHIYLDRYVLLIIILFLWWSLL